MTPLYLASLFYLHLMTAHKRVVKEGETNCSKNALPSQPFLAATAASMWPVALTFIVVNLNCIAFSHRLGLRML